MGPVKEEGKQARTFLSFSNQETLENSFPRQGFRVPPSKVCPVTRLPAKYTDPVTELPYANAASPSIVRTAGGQIIRGLQPGQIVVTAAPGSAQLRQAGAILVSSASAAGGQAVRQHYVISGAGGVGSTAQIVALQAGQTVRPGQLVQVAGQQGQHQIVVSSSGQIVLQPPTPKSQ